MTKSDCKMIAYVYAMSSGCAIGEPKSKCAYYGDGTCGSATCESCARRKQINTCPKLRERENND